MIDLLIDGLIALVKLSDRGIAAVENVCRQPTPRAAADTQPADAGSFPASAPGVGGHPIYSTSELLGCAAGQLAWVYEDRAPAVVRELQAELIDRAAQFRAAGD